jgi:hypothetical protein
MGASSGHVLFSSLMQLATMGSALDQNSFTEESWDKYRGMNYLL